MICNVLPPGVRALVEAVEPLSLSPESGEVGEPGDARLKALLMANALELKVGVSLGPRC